jgi:ATP-dependent exoDNAse (exonuclease V) beta subunit
MPSVTTVLSRLDSQRLQSLEAEMGKEQLEKIGQKAARRGTCMHSFLENYLICMQKTGDNDKSLLYTQKKTPTDLRNEGLDEEAIANGRGLFYNYIHEGYLDRIRKVLCTEMFVWSLKHRFSGTLDFGFADMMMKIVIADFKSANGIKDDETVHKYELQTAAYVMAFEEIYKKKVDRSELWISGPHGIQEVVLAGAAMEERKSEFLQICADFHRDWDAYGIVEKYYKPT